MKAMRVEMAFFDCDTLLAQAMVLVHTEEDSCNIQSDRGDNFNITMLFEEPASQLQIECFSSDGELISNSALRMGVHNSDYWEKIELAAPYELCFKCAIVDSENPNWATQEPIIEEC